MTHWLHGSPAASMEVIVTSMPNCISPARMRQPWWSASSISTVRGLEGGKSLGLRVCCVTFMAPFDRGLYLDLLVEGLAVTLDEEGEGLGARFYVVEVVVLNDLRDSWA